MAGERFHVTAWGSDEHPDLDYRTNEYPRDLSWKYPCISVARISAVRLSDILGSLDAEEEQG